MVRSFLLFHCHMNMYNFHKKRYRVGKYKSNVNKYNAKILFFIIFATEIII